MLPPEKFRSIRIPAAAKAALVFALAAAGLKSRPFKTTNYAAFQNDNYFKTTTS
jgi:hypothetical protein